MVPRLFGPTAFLPLVGLAALGLLLLPSAVLALPDLGLSVLALLLLLVAGLDLEVAAFTRLATVSPARFCLSKVIFSLLSIFLSQRPSSSV